MEPTWDEHSDHDRLEYGLMAGYVIIAVIAVVTGAKGQIGGQLNKAVPERLPGTTHEFLPSVLDLLRTSTDIMAAVALLIVAGYILYRRRKNRLTPDLDPATPKRHFELPFLF